MVNLKNIDSVLSSVTSEVMNIIMKINYTVAMGLAPLVRL